MEANIQLDIHAQPDDTTCGPTCLHALYRFYGDTISLNQVIEEVFSLKGGGTLAVMMACHALRRGYKATIYTYNLNVFDPTWFQPGIDIAAKIAAQSIAKKDSRITLASEAYLEFLALGGKLKYEDLNSALIRKYLKKNIPVLTGLSSTYLYQHPREYGPKSDFDDVRGYPTGHFVLLSGYNMHEQTVSVADPLMDNPYSTKQKYLVEMDKLICAILLGILTHDANLLILHPPKASLA